MKRDKVVGILSDLRNTLTRLTEGSSGKWNRSGKGHIRDQGTDI